MRLHILLSLTAVALAAPAMAATSFTADQIAAARSGAQSMKELNVIVSGNSTHGAEFEGKAWIGGDLNMQGNVGIGAAANGQSFTANSSLATLTVGGNTSGGVHIKNGIGESNVVANVGGSSNGTYFDGTTGTLNAGGSISGLNNTGTGNANVAGLQATIQQQTQMQTHVQVQGWEVGRVPQG